MNEFAPEDPRCPNKAQGSQPSWVPYNSQGSDHPSEHRVEPEKAPEKAPEENWAAGEDEILRSGRTGDADQDSSKAVLMEERAATEVDGGEQRNLVSAKRYTGWLPTNDFLTGREIAIAAFVAAMLSTVLLIVLSLAERWVQLPASAAESGILSALLVGLLCGLYILLRLRAYRLAWRRQLTGDGL